MLKTLKPETFAGTPNAKCGEVYFQSLNSYRIDCTFCEMRSFVFDDFLLHIKNEHLENELLRTDVLLPKQEKLETDSPNMFSWHDVNNDDYDDDNSEHVFISESKELLDDNDDNNAVDPVALTGKIMKWNLAEQVRRQTRTLKVDYNEQSDIENHRSSKAKKIHLPCTQCDKTYLSKKTLARHMDRKHNKAANSTISKVEGVEHDDADNDEGMDGDVDYTPPEQHASKPIIEYKCEKCDKVYQSKHTLRQHEKRDHDHVVGLKPAAFACLECNEELPRLRQLDAHMAKVHGGVPCLFCGRRYKTHHELKRHQIKHTNERNVACTHPGCDKRFFTTRHMHSHRKVHLEQKNFVCESCGYSCRNKETLRVHLRSHTGERPFACKVCDKRFPSHSGLREHMAMHSSERPYVCKVCGATFARQKGLYHHKFLHTETKQFVCKLCGNAYAQAAGLAGHMRKHRNDELNR